MGIENVTPAVHCIRLRGFWTTSTLPDGRTCHRRRFGRPTVSDPREQVWLVIDELPQPVTVQLNDLTIAEGITISVDVTERLNFRNELAIDSLSQETPDGVRIEIRLI